MPDATITPPLWCAAGRSPPPSRFHIGMRWRVSSLNGAQSEAREVRVCVLEGGAMSLPPRSSQNERQKPVAGSFRERIRRLHCPIRACNASRGTQWLLPLEALKARPPHQPGGLPAKGL